MRTISTQIEIGAAPADVWAVLVDLNRYEQWNPFITSAVGVPVEGQFLGIQMDLGEKGRQRYRVRVTRVIPNREFRWLGAFKFPGLIDGDHGFELEEISPRVTLLRHVEHFSGLLVPFVWRGFLRRHLAPAFVHLNQNLQAYCENRPLPIALRRTG